MSQQAAETHANPIEALRVVLELFVLFTLGFWGFAGWPFPWNIVVGIAAPIGSILVWALFRSPHAVFAIDVYGKAIAEVAVICAVAGAWCTFDQPLIACAFAIVAAAIGIVGGWKEIS